MSWSPRSSAQAGSRVALFLLATAAVSPDAIPAAAPRVGSDGSTGCVVVLPEQVRVQDCRLARTVADALQISATLREEFERIAALKGIVYIDTSRYVSLTRRNMRGILSHQVGVSGSICVLRVTLIIDYGDRAVATLAHELFHAIEVLEHPDARTEKAIDALFASIGEAMAYQTFETTGAIEKGRKVLEELRDARRHKPNVRRK
jgi:hypothetical protein